MSAEPPFDGGLEVVLVAAVDVQLLGDETVWDRVSVARHPTSGSFEVDLGSDQGARLVMGCRPGEPPDVPADVAQPEWCDVEHPPTEDDPPVLVLHVIRWADDTARDRMRGYESEAIAVAAPHGVRMGAWLDVEGTVVGDARQWDQVRFNRFPSKAAFMAVATDPRRLEAQAAHREPAMADTYTMILRPTIDRL